MEDARIVRSGDKEAVVFTTTSGVRASVATNLSPELLLKLQRKLERKLRRADHSRPKVDFGLAADETSI
jgi:hypothetical protein